MVLVGSLGRVCFLPLHSLPPLPVPVPGTSRCDIAKENTGGNLAKKTRRHKVPLISETTEKRASIIRIGFLGGDHSRISEGL